MSDVDVRELGDVGETERTFEEELEILVEGRDELPAPKKEDPDEVQRKVAELQGQLEMFKAQASNADTLKGGFDSLAKAFKEREVGGGYSQPQLAPLEDYQSVRKRISEKFWDEPVAAVEQLLKYAIQSEIAPAFQQTQNLLQQTSIQTSRQLAQADETNKLVLEKWPTEVEEALKGVNPGPDAYVKACQFVAFNHLNDLVQLKVEQQAGGGAAGNNAPKRQVANSLPQGLRTGSESSMGSTGTPSRRQVVLTKDQMEIARRRGMSERDAVQLFYGI